MVVARHELSTGESLRQVVVRSGVEQNLQTLEITVTPPSAYAEEHEDLGYRASSERHLVPPKTSQSEAELHGAFDTAIGSSNANRHKVMLAVALRESGTLFDMAVPRLDDPNVSDPQPGIELVSEPGVPESERKTLPLEAGDPPAPGQYVIHDVDELAIPYLPDVAARGISLVFPEAGRDRKILFPFGTEGFTAAYRGSWPAPRPFRLELEGSDVLEGRLVGGEVRVGLPPGTSKGSVSPRPWPGLISTCSGCGESCLRCSGTTRTSPRRPPTGGCGPSPPSIRSLWCTLSPARWKRPGPLP